MSHSSHVHPLATGRLCLAFTLLSTSFGVGCAAGLGDGVLDRPAPAIAGLDADRIAVGEPLRLRGEDLPAADEGWVDVTFAGDFVPADGTERLAVDLTVALAADTEGDLVWDAFGAHRVPFGRGDQLGTFEGWVYGTVRYFDGSTESQAPDSWALVSLEVKPSVVVTDFRAVGETWIADCAEPSTTAIHGIPYGLRIEALGFTPVEARFRVTEGLLIDGEASRETTETRVEMDGDDAAILLRFAAVPAHTDGFRVGIAIELTDEAGAVHHITYPVTVRRPMQVYFERGMELAELYEPTPVSGCIPGGAGGVDSTYSESHSETRTRSIAHTVSRDWTRTYAEAHTETYGSAASLGGSEAAATSSTMTDTTTEGGSELTTDMFSSSTSRTRATSIDFNEASTDSYGWSVNNETFGEINGSVTASAGGSIGFVEIGGEAQAGFVEGSRSGSGETGGTARTSGVSAGATDTSSSTSSEAHTRAAGRHWGRSQSYAETNSFTRTDTWNTTKSFSEASTRSESIAMSLGESDTETLTVSTTDAEALQTTSRVFAGQYGMWYRQTTRLARRGTIVAYDLCGNGSAVGDVNLDDWTWAPGLAIGTTCPPEPDFPEAECRISPCEGGAH